MSFKRVQSRERAERDREQVGVEGPEVLRLKVFGAKQSSRGLFWEVGGFWR